MIERPIFIVGCSRSGTCLLGEILKKHTEVHCLIEYPTTFKYAQYLSVHREAHQLPETISHLQKIYMKAWGRTWRKCQQCSSGCQKIQYRKHSILKPCYDPSKIKRYADKSHPHIVNVDVVRKTFPQAQFIHIYRDARDVITSMLRYDRLVRRFSTKVKINDASVWPQPWYGVRDQNHYREWQKWSLEKKMAHAWEARIQEGRKQSAALPSWQWLDIRYEDLLANPSENVQKIFAFLELSYCMTTHSHLYSKNSKKWETFLQPQQLAEIIENAPSLKVLGYL